MPKAQAHKKWKYDLHPSVRMAQSVIAGMKQKTGHSIDEWVRLAKKDGPDGEKQRAAWLMKEHGLGTNYAARGLRAAHWERATVMKMSASISSTRRIMLTGCTPVQKNICARFTTRY